MPLHLADKLLPVAAAIDADGGRGVLDALCTVLEQEAPFDAGEMVIPGSTRLALRADGHLIAATDLVEEVMARGAVRIDHPGEAERLPATRELMQVHGMRSILALPLGGRPDLRGALVLARRHGWGLVGASLPTLLPLATLAGLAFHAALRMSAPRRSAHAGLADAEADRDQALALLADLERRRGDDGAAQSVVREERDHARAELARASEAREAAEQEVARLTAEMGRVREEMRQMMGVPSVERRKTATPATARRRRNEKG